jgi:molybdenum cofactor sulfurtransferase
MKKVPGLGNQYMSWKLHDGLEDGTLPFHSILALGIAIDTHLRLYGSMVSYNCIGVCQTNHSDSGYDISTLLLSCPFFL